MIRVIGRGLVVKDPSDISSKKFLIAREKCLQMMLIQQEQIAQKENKTINKIKEIIKTVPEWV